MHELGLCEAIVEAIGRHAGDRPVASVRVRVGRLYHVHPEAFEQSFAVAAVGSVAEDARAELVIEPLRGRCRPCGERFESADDVIAVCPVCGGVDVEVASGDQLILESISYRS